MKAFLCLLFCAPLGFAELLTEAFWVGPQFNEIAKEVLSQKNNEDPFDSSVTYGDLECELVDFSQAAVEIDKTRFLSAKDQVWNVGKFAEEKMLKEAGSWILYNETTGYLVAFLSPSSLQQLEAILEEQLPALEESLELSLFETTSSSPNLQKNWEDVLKQKESIALAEVVLPQSKNPVVFELPKGPCITAKSKIESYADKAESSYRVSLEVSATGSFGELSGATSLSLRSNSPVYIEAHHLGKSLILQVILRVRFQNGPECSEWHLYEKDEEPLRIEGVQKGWNTQQGDKDLWYWPFDPNILLEGFPRRMHPNHLPANFDHLNSHQSWFDMTEAFRNSGCDFKEGEKLFYAENDELVLTTCQSEETRTIVGMILEKVMKSERFNHLTCLALWNEDGSKSECLSYLIIPTVSSVGSSFQFSQKELLMKVDLQTIGFDYLGRTAIERSFSWRNGQTLFKRNTSGALLLGKIRKETLASRGDQSWWLEVENVEFGADGKF